MSANRDPSLFLIFGHRGSPKRYPENTLASFEEALRVGADGFETDLRLLADQTAVLFHDDEFQDAEIESLTLAQCTERGATVERLRNLERFAGRARMILEVKRSNWSERLVEHIATWPGVIVTSFDHDFINELHRRSVAFDLGITYYGRIIDAAAYAEKCGATWCFPSQSAVDRTLVSSLHERNIRVVPWTANRADQWARLRADGCDGVITDLPGEAVAWRDEGRDEGRRQKAEGRS
ncbi:MAG TPA: glycerophosphodiester phosphodiesterase [Thermoanaerobaculia bacterium]|nr:glycerophosphodiester phosphodiesterase [Thermoanaerobaculia bacterium]